jgi:alkylation response protein AidB-like acyl-CoA dehydrogenase
MTTATTTEPGTSRSGATADDTIDPVAAVEDWLEGSWDPDLTVAEWWERLGLAGWSAPTLPIESYGRGLSRSDAVAVGRAIQNFGALGAPAGLGLLLAAPTIATHGTRDQIDRYVRDIVTGQTAWCQLFSEPGAGSDLAGLTTRAERDGDEWIVNGQKVWTSLGHMADLGMLIARTDPHAPKHQGITYFAIDMHQDGMDVRPLRDLTGRAMFNEVFMTDARVEDAAIIGGTNNGWAVANTTLMFERAGLGAGGSGGGSMASPGQIAGDLGKRAGDFTGGGGARRRSADPTPEASSSRRGNMYVELARSKGKLEDPVVRQQLAKLHTLNEIAKYNNLRSKAARAAGQPDIPGLPNIAKLSMSDILRLQRDLGLGLLGPMGTLHAYTNEQREQLTAATGDPFTGMFTEGALFAQGPPIYGGTDQIQHNIIGERVLGLPKEPNQDKVLPFKDLPKNG